MYQALLHATKVSLNQMKERICRKTPKNVVDIQPTKPFFEVDVQLQTTSVVMNPSLKEIQNAINRSARAVLVCSKQLYNWDQGHKPEEERETFYDMIATDKEIVKVILLLTGSIEGARNNVNKFLSTFDEFSWLYNIAIEQDIQKFKKSDPGLVEYEAKLKYLVSIEDEIDKIKPQKQIGAMSLLTVNLCDGLKRFASHWKVKYADNLHIIAKYKLETIHD